MGEELKKTPYTKVSTNVLSVLITDDETGTVLGHYKVERDKGIQAIIEYPEKKLTKIFELFRNRFEYFKTLKDLSQNYYFNYYLRSPNETGSEGEETTAENKI